MTTFMQLKDSYKNMDSNDQRLLNFSVIIALGLLLIYSSTAHHIASLAQQRQSREQSLRELMSLKQRYQEAAGDAQRLSNRIASISPNDSPVNIIEELAIIPKGGFQAKPLPQQDRGAYTENSALVTLSGLTLNETVNLLYRLEQGSKPVIIKQANLRTRFNDPSKLDVTMQLSLIRPAATNQVKP